MPTLRGQASGSQRSLTRNQACPLHTPGRISQHGALYSPKPQCSRRGRSPISTLLGPEHQLPALTSGPSQATCPGQKCHITHKVRKGCQALSHQPRRRPDSKLIYREIVTPSHEIFQWWLPCILTHLQREAKKRALFLLSWSSENMSQQKT